ncbi:hypothetical protein [Longitalea luteola]|uniref:hypothetical protein n=1 Tax=Longitalea luteola TaxID=2812563 RepID=UPI001A95C397|nr:hypothetical protein [Longitalea luteola]
MKLLLIKESYASVIFIFLLMVSFVIGCGKKRGEPESVELITDTVKQSSMFKDLLNITNEITPREMRKDSLAFLILPVQASCPSCRKKTIDSLMSHQNKLADRHFVIISANGGRKTINSYFKEQDYELPVIKDKIILDSMNLTYKHDLCDDKPTIYYTYDQKVFKKVASIPATVRNDLHDFFSGTGK